MFLLKKKSTHTQKKPTPYLGYDVNIFRAKNLAVFSLQSDMPKRCCFTGDCVLQLE